MIPLLPLLPGRRPRIAQAVRFAVGGGAVAVFTVAFYAVLAGGAGLPPLIANILAYGAQLPLGHQVHSRYSFRTNPRAGFARYVPLSIGAFLLNSLWVWLLTGLGHLPYWSPIVAMVTITPAISFVVGRLWVFRAD